MIDPMLMRLNEVLLNERLEAAAYARQFAPKPAGRGVLEQLRSAVGARMSHPALPAQASAHNLDRKVTR